MDIEYYKAMEPFFGSWHIVKLLGEGSFGKVFEIERTDEVFGKNYRAALKVISIPQSQSEVASLKSNGMSDSDTELYYKGIVNDFINEYDLMSKLKGNSYVVSCEDYAVIKQKDNVGWDILIRMELLTPLVNRLNNYEMSEQEIVRLGINLCAAVELCEKYNIIHRDIKPENIFISENSEYKLGDFGIARTAEKTNSAMSRKGTFNYMAPEVYNGRPYGRSVDIYSVGLVLYKLLNKNRAPFYPNYPQPISYADNESALLRRMNGEALPEPLTGSASLKRIVLKASAFEPAQRYGSAIEMRRELEALENSNVTLNSGQMTDNDRTVRAVQTADAEQTVAMSPAMDSAQLNAQPTEKTAKKNNNVKVIAIVAASIAAVALIAVLLIVVLGKGRNSYSSSRDKDGSNDKYTAELNDDRSQFLIFNAFDDNYSLTYVKNSAQDILLADTINNLKDNGAVCVTGEDVRKASLKKVDDQYVIEIEFTEAGKSAFADGSEKSMDSYMPVCFFGEIIYCPMVKMPITDGVVWLQGTNCTQDEAMVIVDYLNKKGSGAMALVSLADFGGYVNEVRCEGGFDEVLSEIDKNGYSEIRIISELDEKTTSEYMKQIQRLDEVENIEYLASNTVIQKIASAENELEAAAQNIGQSINCIEAAEQCVMPNDEMYCAIYDAGAKTDRFISGDGFTLPDDYDPTQRVWYLETKNSGKYKSIYQDAVSNNYYVTVTRPIYKNGEFIGVVARDIIIE